MAQNVPMAELISDRTAHFVAITPAGIGVVADSTVDRAAKRPANAANNTQTHMIGVTVNATVAANQKARIACMPGEVVPALANGVITRGDVVFLTSFDAGKEGYFKKYTNFATDGAVVQAGVARTSAADGEQFELILGVGGYIKPS
jgi:hypothetical protein